MTKRTAPLERPRPATFVPAALALTVSLLAASAKIAMPENFTKAVECAMRAVQTHAPVFEVAVLDRSLEWLGFFPSELAIAAGDHGGWCISQACFETAFRVQFVDGNVRIGDFSLLTFLASALMAAFLCQLGMWHTGFWCRTLFTRFDPSKIQMPSQLPWPDNEGQSVPFDVPVLQADAGQVARFLAFRGAPLPETDSARREAAAREAIAYMAELWETKLDAWSHKHYGLGQRGMVFPYRAPFMDNWGFWSETSAQFRSVGCGQITFACEHFLIGVLLPCLYVATGNESYFYFALYADMGVETYDLLAIAWRRVTGADHTVSRYDKATDKVLVPHHVFTVGFELVGLMAGAPVSKRFMLQIFVSAHLTGGLIYAAICAHQSPALAWRRFLYYFQAGVLSSIYVCRIFGWLPIAVAVLRLAHVSAGEFPPHVGLKGLGNAYPLLSPVFLTTFVLCAFYTYFNIDMVQYHSKLLRKAAARL